MRKSFNKRELALMTRHEVFTPRYHDKRDSDEKEWVCLIPCYKIRGGSPLQLIDYTRAKHLIGLRYFIKRSEVEQCHVHQVKSKQGNMVDMYEIPEHLWHTWETTEELHDTAMELFD